MKKSEASVLESADSKKQNYDWGELTWFASAELGNSDYQTIGCCIIRPGMENPSHCHPNCEEVLHVLSGYIVHSMTSGSEVEMSAGDTITLPAGVPHNARNTGEQDAVLLVCFSSAERQFAKTPLCGGPPKL